MFRFAALCCVATAVVAATSQLRAQPPMFDPGEMIKRMDDNDNGQIDPSEMEGRARGFLESIACDNNLDLSKPIPNDKLRDIMKARFQGGGSSRSSGGSSSSRSAAPAPAVKTFGVSTTGPTPTVLGFGDSAGADSWDALKSRYDPKVIERTEDSMRRYDRNQDGVLDAQELKENRWDSGHPLDFDKNRDGKIQRNEMAERYKQRYSSGYYDNRGGDRGPYGGGPPGGFNGPPPTISMSSSSSSGSSRGPTPPTSSGSGGSGSSSSSSGSSSGSKPSSSGSSGGSGSGGAPDDRMMKYADGLLKQYDSNKDGTLQREEWSKMRSESQKADRDGNGLITKEELAAQLADYSKGRSGGSSSGSSSSSNSGSTGSSYSRSSSSGSRYSSSGSSASRSSGSVKTYRFLSPAERLPSGLPDWFTRNDADGDGQIAMAEFSTSWDDQKAAEFTRWDRNGDGVITPKEALGSGQ